ncbi:MAG TPA: bifunctional serine/threonine-protein kinase/formylglycine-generating enzyme family protein, partial [Gemmataceae bacterium]|nr:bifunctional serine/threonine-protein kinase/formylglycine-generating enzyme family protein [Gemmataceae bacterium]
MTSPLSLPESFGKYRVACQIGQGGMGSVWLAHDTLLARAVALKVPHLNNSDDPDPVILARFKREAKAAAALHHPNLCPVYEVGEIAGIHYIAMAYIEGRPLAEFIHPGQPFPQQQAAALICRLACALYEAHRKDIVHRDLKPTNILIDQRGEPIIMDFGLAKRMDHETPVTRFGSLLGTPEYMPPEQVEGNLAAVCPASDVYSLGVILYELLTSRVPFTEDNVYSLLYQIVNRDPPRVSEFRLDVDPGLESACLKALAKRVEDRHADMPAFAAALEQYLNRENGHGVSPLIPPNAPPFRMAEGPPTVLPNDLSVDCPACGRRLKVPASALGRKARCSACKASFQVPSDLKEPKGVPTVRLELADALTERLVNSIGMKFVLVPPGRFLMGSPLTEAERGTDEGPQHEVIITRPFYLGMYLVTQREYEHVTGESPSHFSLIGDGQEKVLGLDTSHFPVEQVSWEDAVAFCRMMSDIPQERRRGRLYRLPTEADWEYACRGGAAGTGPFPFGSSLSSFQANFNGRHPYGGASEGPYLERTTAVGSYPPNGFGLFDMHGNVWEW